jgi:hypothetical protein
MKSFDLGVILGLIYMHRLKLDIVQVQYGLGHPFFFCLIQS